MAYDISTFLHYASESHIIPSGMSIFRIIYDECFDVRNRSSIVSMSICPKTGCHLHQV